MKDPPKSNKKMSESQLIMKNDIGAGNLKKI